MSFETLGLSPILLSAIQKTGFTVPTDVQTAAIPKALEGHDLMVSSQTGSGKTAAFMLPALNRIANMPSNKGTGVQVLVLTPTRELAMQVAEATKQYGAHIKDLRIAIVVGGMPYGAQLKALSRRVDVLVATPGRLIDHLQAGRVNLSTVHTLVLDEADRMLDMGFIEDIENIVSRTPAERQTLLFSATLDGNIARMAGKMLRSPQRIEISNQKQKHSNITQSLYYADDNGHKMRLLDHVLSDTSLNQAIVFTSTKRGADDLADRLSNQGHAVAALHGDMNQRQRTRTLGLLQKGKLRILVATDVASRGIDVQGISHAVNYDLPMQAEDYVHRIGRTGRAGHSGLAFTLAMHSERHKIRRIEHFIGQPIPMEVIEGLEPQKTVRPTYTDRNKGKGKSSGAPRTGYAGKPGQPRKSFGDRPARGDQPAYEGRGKPAYQGGAASERGTDSRNPFSPGAREGYKPRGDSYKPRGEGFAGRGASSEGYKGRSDRPAAPGAGRSAPADRPAYGDRPARPARPAEFARKPASKTTRPARPSFSGKSTSGPAKSSTHREDFAG